MPHATRWIGFHLALLVLLAVEFFSTRRIRDTHRKAVFATVLWVTASLVLAGMLWFHSGQPSAVQYLAGYAIEEALSIDNLFVFLLLFKLFRVPEGRQQRVLFWGVLGAMVMRGAFIFAGIGLLERFHWIDYLFGVILLIASVRLLFPDQHEAEPKTPRWIAWLRRVQPISERQDAFFVEENGKHLITVLMLALIAVELTDVVFALDSIPAVLSITREPFLAYSSNIMAVMGLRSLYILLAAMLARLRFLHFGLAAVLAFAGLKMLATEWIEVGPVASLVVIGVLLGVTVGASLIRPAPASAA